MSATPEPLGPASRALTTALTVLAVSRQRTPCQGDDRELWFGAPAERLEAAGRCQSCPVMPERRAFGDEIGTRWGVFGGVDLESERSRR